MTGNSGVSGYSRRNDRGGETPSVRRPNSTVAWSIASKLSWDRRARPVSARSWTSTASRPSCPPSSVVNSTTRIRFSVRVPVLSEQSTVAAPMVSSAAIRRARTLLRAIRYAPSARKTVTTTGNSSGSSEMARVRPASRPPFQSARPSP